MKAITFELPDEVHDEVVRDAEALGLAKSPYSRDVILQRHSKELVLKPDDVRLIARLEGKLETLQAQNNNLTDRLASTAQQAGMAGVETTNSAKTTSEKNIIAAAKKEWQADLDQKELERLRVSDKEKDALIQELEEHKASNDKFDKALDKAEKVVMSNPAILTGLLGIAGVKLPGMTPDAGAGLGGTPEDERALAFGRAFVTQLPQAVQDEMGIVLNHLTQHPEDIKAILATKTFAAVRKAAMTERAQQAA